MHVAPCHLRDGLVETDHRWIYSEVDLIALIDHDYAHCTEMKRFLYELS